MLKRKLLVSGCIATALLCNATFAQESSNTKPVPFQTKADQERQEATKQMSVSSVVTPQHIAACLALDNQEEVVLAKYAQDKTEDKEVAKFAKMIFEEHQACLKKLSKLVPNATSEGFLTGNRDDQPTVRSEAGKSITLQDTNTGSRNGDLKNPSTFGQQAGGVDSMQLQREIAQQCINDSKEALSKKDGAEFDKCFVGMQIAKHYAMHTKLVVLQRHTSDELQEIVSEGVKATAKHIKAAESLMANLNDQDSEKLSKNDK